MYEEAPSLNAVAEFHYSFNHPVKEKPMIPAEKRVKLRIDLIQEELDELKEGIKNDDIVEVADALCDLQYVLSGAILEFGLAEKFKDLFLEVQRSNMSKACRTEREAIATVEHYQDNGIPCHFEKRGNYFVVYRNADKKIMKSISYSPANLKTLLKEKS
ncbi:hypothetical protein [Flagellimonas sp.]|uniref:hypothetical protein n=1 Tax=Flagellimonas sp. TaxID=2058762 RepID=UPI003BA9F57A